jgi:NADH-quinone oxidoreductase subunit E
LEKEQQLDDILDSYKGKQGSLIPVLQKVQERVGYLPEEVVSEIAKSLRVPPSEIFGTLTFYAQFRTTPTGRNRVTVCRGTACHVRGGTRVLDAVQHELEIKEGETTPDLEYTIETVACIGACALAPTMRINKDTHGRLNPKKVAEIFRHSKEEA